MAITTLFLTGFEHGFVGAGANAGLGLFDTAPGSGWTASTSSPRNGSYCAHLVAPANTATFLRKTISGTDTTVAQRFAVKVMSRPASGTAVIAHSLDQVGVVVFSVSVSSAGVLSLAMTGGSAVTGPTIDTTNWHLIELSYNGTIDQMEWKVDGASQATASGSGIGFVKDASLGTNLATQPGYTADFDDWIVGVAASLGEFYGDGKVLRQLAGVDGTHATVTSLSPGDAGTAYSGTVTTANTMVDDPPGTGAWSAAARSTTDNIALRVATVGAYMEIKPATTAEAGQARAVRAIMAYSSSATQANLAACDVRNSAGAVDELWGLTGGVGKDYSETSNFFKGAIVTAPAAGWTAAEVNAIRFRFGGCTSADISPVPTVQALMLEVDWPVSYTVFTDSGLGTITVSGIGTEFYSVPTPYDQVIDVDNPVSHWKLGETTQATDRKGVQNLLASNGPIVTAPSLIANNDTNLANTLVSASSQSYSVNNSSNIGIPYNTSVWSIEAWIKLTTQQSQNFVYRALSNQSIGTSSSGYLVLEADDGTNVGRQAFQAVALSLNQIHHVVGTFDGSNLILYLNGVEFARRAMSGLDSSPDTVPIIGTTGSLSYLNGVIDEVAWYSTALSAARVLAHYNAGRSDDSASGTITASGSRTESYSASDSRTFSITASGSGVESLVYTDSPPYIKNPSFETDLSGWTQTTAAGLTDITWARENGWAQDGSWSLHMKGTSGATGSAYSLTAWGTTGISGIPVSPSLPYTLGAWVNPLTPMGSTYGIRLAIHWYTASGAVASPSSTVSGYFTPTSPQRLTYRVSAPPDAAFAAPRLYIYWGAAAPSNTTLEAYFDSITFSDDNLILDGTGVEKQIFGYEVRVLADNPVAYWRLHDLSDSSGHGFDLTQYGTTPAVPSLIVTDPGNDAKNFNSVSIDGLARGDEVPLRLSTAFSFEAWVKVGFIGGAQFDVLWKEDHYKLTQTTGDRFRAEVLTTGGFWQAVGTTIPVVDQIYHLVGTFDGVNTRLYVNGVLEGISAVVSGSPRTTLNAVSIGYNPSGAATGWYGDADEVAIYNNVLSAATIAEHYTTSGRVVSYIYPDSASGTIVASGTAVETADFGDAATATTLASGTGVESYGVGYLDSASGTINVSGSGTDSAAISEAATGIAITSGTNTESYSISEVSSGTIGASGTSVESYLHSVSISGTITATGSVTESFSIVDAVSGTVTVSGLGTEAYSYLDSRTGTVTVSGSGIELYGFDDSRICTVTASGNGLEVYGFDDNRLCTLTVGGSGMEFYVATENASGTITVSGTGVENYQISSNYVDSASGTGIASGTGSESYVESSVVTGNIVSNGTSVESHVESNTATGSFVASGTSTETSSTSDAISGIVTVSGTLVESYIHSGSVSGTITATGSSIESGSINDTVSGTVIVNGTSVETTVHNASGVGTSSFSGMGIDSLVYDDVVSGSSSVSGTGVDSSETLIDYVDARSGQITLTGTSVEAYSQTVTALGSVLAAGTGIEAYSHTSTATGSLLVEGTSTEAQTYTSTALGSGLVTGAGSEAYSHTNTVNGVVSLNGVGSEVYEPPSGEVIYGDAATGIITSTGIGTETVVYSQTVSGTITGTGTRVETFVYSDALLGTLTSTGIGIESASHSFTLIGIITSTGTEDEGVDYSNAGTGTLGLRGSGAESCAYTDISTGVMTFTGIGHELHPVIRLITFSTVVALNPFKVTIKATSIKTTVISESLPVIQVGVPRHILVKVTKRNEAKILVTR